MPHVAPKKKFKMLSAEAAAGIVTCILTAWGIHLIYSPPVVEVKSDVVTSKEVTRRERGASAIQLDQPRNHEEVDDKVRIAGRAAFPEDDLNVVVGSGSAAPTIQNTEIIRAPDGTFTAWADLGNAAIGIAEIYTIQVVAHSKMRPDYKSDVVTVRRVR